MTMPLNLLPWRELKRTRQKNIFITVLILAICVPVFVTIMVFFATSFSLSQQIGLNQRLQDQTAALERQNDQVKSLERRREKLALNLQFFAKLHNSCMLTIHLLDDIIKIIPDGVYLTQAQQLDREVILLGYAQSNTEIASLLRKMAQNEWIRGVELSEIKKEAEGQAFKLSFKFQPKAVSNETV